tara:strand:- start:272 stop:1081 length:810 start_codon:yes stop_codon:yes gene_type:complete
MINTILKNQIKSERRRRNQSYQSLDYMLSRITYFDFFSADAFNIAKYSKYFGQLFAKKTITSEFLLFPFFYCDSNLYELLDECEIKDKFLDLLNDRLNTQKLSKKVLNELPNSLKNENLPYATEVNLIFEKAAENALVRFKTPVITSEILFLTLMESLDTKVGKLIQTQILTSTEWHLLRYRLIKSLHKNESIIRSDVSKNQHYFAYLLKTELSELEFNKLVDTDSLVTGVQLFRNMLITKLTKVNIFNLVFEEIKKSIRITNKRKYSR